MTDNTAAGAIDAAAHDLAKDAFKQFHSTLLSAPSADHKVALDQFNRSMAAIALARAVSAPGWAEENAKAAAAQREADHKAIMPSRAEQPKGQFAPAPLTHAPA